MLAPEDRTPGVGVGQGVLDGDGAPQVHQGQPEEHLEGHAHEHGDDSRGERRPVRELVDRHHGPTEQAAEHEHDHMAGVMDQGVSEGESVEGGEEEGVHRRVVQDPGD